MKYKKIVLLLLFVIISISSFSQRVQGFNNMDNLGQQAFNILKNFQNTSKEQFRDYFTFALSIDKAVPGYTDMAYDNIKVLEKKKKIKWKDIEFADFKYYKDFIEEDGLLITKGRVYIKFSGNEGSIQVYIAQYKGKYYLLSIG